MLKIDPARGLMGAVTKDMENPIGFICRRGPAIHRDQAIVESLNRTLGERVFGYQCAVQMRLPEGQRSTVWVKRLTDVVAALNNEVTRPTGKTEE